MSLIKFSNRNRLFPWDNFGLKDFLGSDALFNDRYFEEYGLLPAMNIKEHENDFEIEFAAPGFSKKDFKVTIDGDFLNVIGEISHEEEQKDEEYTRKEFSYNHFTRSLKLPNTIDKEKDIKATYKNGILRLNLLKNEAFKPTPKKVIEVM